MNIVISSDVCSVTGSKSRRNRLAEGHGIALLVLGQVPLPLQPDRTLLHAPS